MSSAWHRQSYLPKPFETAWVRWAHLGHGRSTLAENPGMYHIRYSALTMLEYSRCRAHPCTPKGGEPGARLTKHCWASEGELLPGRTHRSVDPPSVTPPFNSLREYVTWRRLRSVVTRPQLNRSVTLLNNILSLY